MSLDISNCDGCYNKYVQSTDNKAKCLTDAVLLKPIYRIVTANK